MKKKEGQSKLQISKPQLQESSASRQNLEQREMQMRSMSWGWDGNFCMSIQKMFIFKWERERAREEKPYFGVGKEMKVYFGK